MTTQSIRWPESGGLTWPADSLNPAPELSALAQEIVDTNGALAKDSYLQFWIGSGEILNDNYEVAFVDYEGSVSTTSELLLVFY